MLLLRNQDTRAAFRIPREAGGVTTQKKKIEHEHEYARNRACRSGIFFGAEV